MAFKLSAFLVILLFVVYLNNGAVAINGPTARTALPSSTKKHHDKKVASIRRDGGGDRPDDLLPLHRRLRGGGDEDVAPGIRTDPLAILSYTAAIALGVFTVLLVRKIPRTGGRPPSFVTNVINIPDPYGVVLYHAAYIVHAIIVVLLMPEPLKSIIFSNGGVIFLGTVFPMVESINAACTDVETDNTTWLQYWCMHGAFEYATEFMDTLAEKYPRVFGNWFAFEFYVLLWLILPFTDGAAVLFDLVTKPYVVPILRPIKKKCEGWLTTLALAIVNASHIWFFAGLFMTLPVLLKRATVMTMGTVYPVLSSIISIADGEVTRWLTYWSCFSILFLAMLFAEKTIGPVPGLYTLTLAAVMYLMLPIFNGSDAVFRNILVPLFQQREALIIKDARTLAKTMIKQLPADRHEAAHKAASEAFFAEVKKATGKRVQETTK